MPVLPRTKWMAYGEPRKAEFEELKQRMGR